MLKFIQNNREITALLAVVLLAWSGAFGGPLTAAMELVLRGWCCCLYYPVFSTASI